jgi:hypothetical protein
MFGNYEDDMKRPIFEDADDFMPFSLHCKRMHSLFDDYNNADEFEEFMPVSKR